MSDSTNKTDAAPLCPACGAKMVKGEDGLYSCAKHGTAKMEQPEEDSVHPCPKCGAPMAKSAEGYTCKACASARTKDTVDRVDGLYAYDPSSEAEAEGMGLIQRFKKDGNGFLVGKAQVTNIGVFSYVLPNGMVRREYRPRSEVMDTESLASLKLVPFTNDHPATKVTPENASSLSIGSIGDGISTTSDGVFAPIVITDAAAIADAEAGKQALSCGYRCEIDETPGVWNGVAYDVIQRNIRYNHVALVTRGRAGDAAVIKLDGADVAVGTQILPTIKEHTMKIKLDSAEVEVADSVGQAFNALQSKLDASEASHKEALATVQAKADAAEAQVESLKAELATAPAKLDAAIKARMDLVAQAQSVGVEAKADQDDSAIKSAIVTKAFPKADSEKLKEPAYMAAMLDSALLVLADAKPHNDAAPSHAGLGVVNADGCGAPVNAMKAKKDYEDRIKNAWREGKSEKK